MKLIECVPNFSEGRDKGFIDSLKNIVNNHENVFLLDIDPGADTNRTVLTFAGNPDDVIKAAYKLIKFASKSIDMRKHSGEHPRMGATDVCPIVPIEGVSMKDCINYSKKLAKKVASDLSIPVYLYENSATKNDRKNLSNIRKGEYEGMHAKINEKNWKPDYGPVEFNTKSGCTAIGAREFLIAYNINLNTKDKKLATDIALDIREAGRLKRDKNGVILRDKNGIGLKKPGKLKFCKAVGWYIDEYNQAQVSINLTNFKKTNIHKTFEEVRLQARKRGLRVTGSEIVGLVPKKAIIDAGNYYLKKQKRSQGIPENDIINIAIKSLGLNEIEIFNPKNKIIEFSIDTKEKLTDLSLSNFLDEVSRDSFAPGGGSVAALSASLGASLTAMVSNLTFSNKKYLKHKDFHLKSSIVSQKHKSELLNAINNDTDSYNEIIKARRLPKKSKKEALYRDEEILKATLNATEVPFKILKTCTSAIQHTYDVSLKSNINSISDIAVASQMLKSAAKGAYYNVLINLNDLPNKYHKHYLETSDYYLKQIDDFHHKIIEYSRNHLINK